MNENVSDITELRAFVEAALLESYSCIFLVNVNTGKYEIIKDDGVLDNTPKGVENIYSYMQQLITDRIIYPEYATACRRFTNPEYVRKSVFSGERRIVQSYRRRTSHGDRWITFAIVVGPDCSPENPIVLYTWRDADSDSITLRDTLPTISSLYDKLIRINLTNNTYEPVLVDADEQERLVGGVINMYEWWAGYSQDGNIASEDMSAFSTLTRTGSLQKRFADDPTPVSFRYRRKVNDEFRWVQLEISPSVEYSEENQIMLLSLKDIHEEYTAQMRSRQELIDNMNRDALTNLYNRLKFNEDIDNLSKSSGDVFTCLYVDVNGLHEMNNLLGHQKGDEMLCCIADTLKEYFPDEKVYRIGGDEYVVTSTTLSKYKIGLIVEQVRRDLMKKNYEIAVGIESGSCGKGVEQIVAGAEVNMRDDKAAYYMRSGDRRRERKMNEELEKLLKDKSDAERFLNAISRQFVGVTCVNLKNDTYRHIYTPDFFWKLFKDIDSTYTSTLRAYVEKSVVPEDWPLFEDFLNFNKLEEMVSESGMVELLYRKTNGQNMRLRVLKVDNRKDAEPATIWIYDRKDSDK